MAVKRKLSIKKYLLAFVLTIIIFSGGIVAGILLENARLQFAQQSTLEEKVNLRSLQLQQQFIQSGSADCPTLHKILDNSINELGRKNELIVDYEQRAILNDKEFQLQRRDYFLTEIQFYLIAKEIEQKCQKQSVKILYFYDRDKYETQGDILGYLKKRFGPDLLIFSFDVEFIEEPMIHILLTSYNITTFPAIVIEDTIFEGHKKVEELKAEICKTFAKQRRDLPKDCIFSS